MPDGKKSGKLKGFLRTLRGITKFGRFVPGPIGIIMGLINEGTVAAQALNGPGNGQVKKQQVMTTAQRVIEALEGEGLFKVPADLKENLPDLIDSIVADQKQIGALPEEGDEGALPSEFRGNTAHPVRFNFSGPGTIEFELDPS